MAAFVWVKLLRFKKYFALCRGLVYSKLATASF